MPSSSYPSRVRTVIADLRSAQHPQDQPAGAATSAHREATCSVLPQIASVRIFWAADGRALEHKRRRRLPVQNLTQQEGHRERPTLAPGRPPPSAAGAAADRFPGRAGPSHRQQHRKAAVAGDHGVRADGNQLFPPASALIRRPVTPTVLQPSPMHMVSACRPEAPARSNGDPSGRRRGADSRRPPARKAGKKMAAGQPDRP